FHPRRKGSDLRGVRDVALNRVELRVFCFHLIEHRLAAASHDDRIAEFEKLERESKADAGRASSDENGATGEFHRNSFIADDTNRNSVFEVRLLMIEPFGYECSSTACASSLETAAGFTPNHIE